MGEPSLHATARSSLIDAQSSAHIFDKVFREVYLPQHHPLASSGVLQVFVFSGSGRPKTVAPRTVAGQCGAQLAYAHRAPPCRAAIIC